MDLFLSNKYISNSWIENQKMDNNKCPIYKTRIENRK